MCLMPQELVLITCHVSMLDHEHGKHGKETSTAQPESLTGGITSADLHGQTTHCRDSRREVFQANSPPNLRRTATQYNDLPQDRSKLFCTKLRC